MHQVQFWTGNLSHLFTFCLTCCHTFSHTLLHPITQAVAYAACRLLYIQYYTCCTQAICMSLHMLLIRPRMHTTIDAVLQGAASDREACAIQEETKGGGTPTPYIPPGSTHQVWSLGATKQHNGSAEETASSIWGQLGARIRICSVGGCQIIWQGIQQSPC